MLQKYLCFFHDSNPKAIMVNHGAYIILKAKYSLLICLGGGGSGAGVSAGLFKLVPLVRTSGGCTGVDFFLLILSLCFLLLMWIGHTESLLTIVSQTMHQSWPSLYVWERWLRTIAVYSMDNLHRYNYKDRSLLWLPQKNKVLFI